MSPTGSFLFISFCSLCFSPSLSTSHFFKTHLSLFVHRLSSSLAPLFLCLMHTHFSWLRLYFTAVLFSLYPSPSSSHPSLSLRDGLRSTGSRVSVSCYSMWARNSTIPPFQIACFLARKEHVHTHSLPPAKWSTNMHILTCIFFT